MKISVSLLLLLSLLSSSFVYALPDPSQGGLHLRDDNFDGKGCNRNDDCGHDNQMFCHGNEKRCRHKGHENDQCDDNDGCWDGKCQEKKCRFMKRGDFCNRQNDCRHPEDFCRAISHDGSWKFDHGFDFKCDDRVKFHRLAGCPCSHDEDCNGPFKCNINGGFSRFCGKD